MHRAERHVHDAAGQERRDRPLALRGGQRLPELLQRHRRGRRAQAPRQQPVEAHGLGRAEARGHRPHHPGPGEGPGQAGALEAPGPRRAVRLDLGPGRLDHAPEGDAARAGRLAGPARQALVHHPRERVVDLGHALVHRPHRGDAPPRRGGLEPGDAERGAVGQAEAAGHALRDVVARRRRPGRVPGHQAPAGMGPSTPAGSKASFRRRMMASPAGAGPHGSRAELLRGVGHDGVSAHPGGQRADPGARRPRSPPPPRRCPPRAPPRRAAPRPRAPGPARPARRAGPRRAPAPSPRGPAARPRPPCRTGRPRPAG